jgi:hypothetical protein
MCLQSRTQFSAIHTAISLILSLALASSSLAQTRIDRLLQLSLQPPSGQSPQQSPQQTEEEKKAAKELEGKALALMDDLATEAMALRLVENRVYLLTGAAETLWSYDERKARALMREAMNQVIAQAREASEKAAREGDQYFDPRFARQYDTSYLRSLVMNLLSRRDPKMALEFLQAMRALRPTERRNPGEEQQEKMLELNLASQIADSDPKTALQIAEEYLDGKLDYQLLNLWNALQRKDPDAAAPLTDRILSQLKSQDALGDYESLNLAFAVATTMKSRLAEITNAQKNPDAANAAQPSPSTLAGIRQAYSAALEMLADAVAKVTVDNLINPQEADRARTLLSQILGFLPDVEKLLPSRIAAVRAKLAQFNTAKYRTPYEMFYAEYGNDLNNKSAQDLLALATKAPPEIRQNFYYQAVNKAMETGDDETARKIVRENVPDKWQANSMLSEIERRGADRAVGEGKFADARRTLAKMRTDEQRASALAGWASAAMNRGDQKLAREMLQEARALIGSRMQRSDQLEAQLAVANVAANFDLDSSFEIAGEAVERLNRLIAANQEIQSFGGMEEGEMRIRNIGGNTANVSPLLAILARKDFDRAGAVLKRWQADEVRLMMSLSVAQNILTGNGRGYGGGIGAGHANGV